MIDLPKIIDAQKKTAEIKAQQKIQENKVRYEFLMSLQHNLALSIRMGISAGCVAAYEYTYGRLTSDEFKLVAKPFKDLGYKVKQVPDNCGRLKLEAYWGTKKVRWFSWF